MALAETLRLVAYALGAVGGGLVFVEFFQMPSYVEFDPEFERYDVDLHPAEVTEHTWSGRVGGLLIALAFALLFLAALVG